MSTSPPAPDRLEQYHLADAPRSLATVSVVDRAAAELLRLIQNNHLRVGDKLLAEPELARQLGVGRSTVREAKHVLLAKGVLESRGKVGTFVAAPEDRRLPLELLQVLLTEQRVEDLHEVRNILEVGAIQLTCKNATDAELDHLDSLLDDLADIDDDHEFWAGTVVFHEMIMQSCHNTTISYIYRTLSDEMRADQLVLHAHGNDRRVGVELHRRLVAALRTRNAAAAAAAMIEHLARSHHHDMAVSRQVRGERSDG